MSLEGGREGREGGEGRGWDGMGWEGRGGEGRGGEGMGWDGMGWDGMGWEGRGGREGEGRDDYYTYYSDGTIYSVYRPTMKNYIYITMTSRIT